MTGFHEGELSVQRRAGVDAEAARLSGMVAPASISRGVSAFLAERRFAVLSARDVHGRLWAAPLAGSPGFLDGSGSRLVVHAKPATGDALAALPDGQLVGLLAIEFAIRRRFRVNGTLTKVADDLEIAVDQAFGNCPQYTHPRQLPPTSAEASTVPQIADMLDEADKVMIAQADTFFLATIHPDRGADASHRGGPAGFVRVEGGQLWWPDYPGNNMFNSFGNLAVDPTAALLFVDFASGRTLQVSGTATIEWDGAKLDGIDQPLDTGRRVRFTPERVVRSSSGVAAPSLPAAQ